MRAWALQHPAPAAEHSLRLVERAVPEPAPNEILVQVHVCGVCRTDLHLVEGDLAPRRPGVVPGHEVVGRRGRTGTGARRFAEGDRVGIAWLRAHLRRVPVLPARRREPLPAAVFTGWDRRRRLRRVRAVADERYAYQVPDVFPDSQAAPLLCAGIIGYRALRRSGLRPAVASASTASAAPPT